jgi:Type IV secretory pathway, TrbD component
MRKTLFFRALHRPQQIMGGERELVLLVALFCAILIISAMNIVSAVIGVAIWFFSIFALRQMAKVDPVMSKVYVRQLRFRQYYPAHSTPWRVGRSTREY